MLGVNVIGVFWRLFAGSFTQHAPVRASHAPLTLLNDASHALLVLCPTLDSLCSRHLLGLF
eukprot:COSAG06_NODE_57808_length_279_cov_0.577778_1_plen_60_part_01